MDESGEEKEPGNIRSGTRGGLEDARGEATLTSNHKPQPQDTTLRITIESSEGQEPRDGSRRTGSRRAEERRRRERNPRRVVGRMWKMGETWAKKKKTYLVNKKVLVQ